MAKTRSVVALANENVPILFVCRLISMDVPDDIYGHSVKVVCPFAWAYHSDQGQEASFRIYPQTNSAYCFSEKELFTPIRLYARVNDLAYSEAAVRLLDEIGYKPASYAHEWEKIVAKRQEVSREALGEALRVYCARVDGSFESRQFEPEVSAQLSRCLDLLGRVETAEDARLWMAAVKRVMRNELRSRENAYIE